MTADEIIAAARACLGTPFRHQGRQVGVGLDCAGVAIHVARTVGCAVLDHEGYGRTPAHGLFETMLEAQGCLRRVPDIAGRRPGDLLLMRFAGEPQHVAIFAGATLIHAWEAPGLCCEHDIDTVWARRIRRVYRFVGMESGDE